MTNLFDKVPHTPAWHFRLYFYGAVLQLIEQLSYTFESPEEVMQQFPFLVGYWNEIAAHGGEGLTLEEAGHRWRESLLAWEEASDAHLPLRALRLSADLDYEAVVLLLTVGMNEEDARFGAVFEALHGAAGGAAPTCGLLHTWQLRGAQGRGARLTLRRLHELGLVQAAAEAPRADRVLRVPVMLWDVLQGETHEAPAPWVRYRAPDALVGQDDLIIPPTLRRKLTMLPQLFASGEAQALVVRGAQRNGRRTLAGSVARSLGRGVLEVSETFGPEDERWKLLGALAVLTNSMPVVVLDLPPGETAEAPALEGYRGPLAFVLGRQGGLSGAGVEHSLTVTVEMPDAAARREHWRRSLEGCGDEELDAIAGRFRITGGNVRRAARFASAYAALDGRSAVTLEDVRRASRDLNRQSLDTLASRVEASGDWSCLAVKPETMRELEDLESRCRHRERLRDAVGEGLGRQLNAGVRALFSGPSGTGKTLAARLLASVLRMDLYRLDLSSIVNKYIGETEKSLNQVFARAEELDVVLLLDEGDALLTQRTSVQNSNDRYANLETNYLLQRLENFEGILVVTTNASERIDGAFQRRMDVVVDFRPPELAEMRAIWELHLPPRHAVGDELLAEVSRRCSLSGGQIRNAVLHASLLSLDDGGVMTSAHLQTAVRREYRKLGAVCPLRTPHEPSAVGHF